MVSYAFRSYAVSVIGPRIHTELAFRVAGLVYDEVGGDPAKRPVEFL